MSLIAAQVEDVLFLKIPYRPSICDSGNKFGVRRWLDDLLIQDYALNATTVEVWGECTGLRLKDKLNLGHREPGQEQNQRDQDLKNQCFNRPAVDARSLFDYEKSMLAELASTIDKQFGANLFSQNLDCFDFFL